MRVFLSHSSKDKTNFVNDVAKILGTSRAIIDEKSFIPSEDNTHEIERLIASCDIFVFFISNNSIPFSKYIKKEIRCIKKYLDKNEKIFMPFIIEENITIENKHIPEWFKKYNLRQTLKYKKITNLIITKINEITFLKNEFAKKRSEIFIGRNDLVEKFEDTYYDINEKNCIFYFMSGFDGIGRRALARHCLQKVRKINDSYVFPTITLDKSNSIEDLIFKMNDLDVSEDINIENLINKNFNDKIDMCVNIFSNYKNNDDIVVIYDKGCLVSSNGHINSWFVKILERIDSKSNSIRAIICTNYRTTYIKDEMKFFPIQELLPKERFGLLIEYLKLFKLNLTDQEIKTCLNWLDGFPNQIYYLASYISQNSYKTTHENSNHIVNHSLGKVEIILQEYFNIKWKMEFMSTISKLELVNTDTLFKVFKDEKYGPFFNELVSKNICILEGISGEYIRISEIIANYIQRMRIPLCSEAFESLKTLIKQDIATFPDTTPDMPSIYFLMKDKIINTGNFDDKYIFPSHLAKSMREIYDTRHDDKQVIKIAKYILSKKLTIGEDILNVARYYFCLALARRKDVAVLSEANNLHDQDRHFIRGFYYRKKGCFIQSIEEFNRCLSLNSNHVRAKGELVTSLMRVGSTDKAFSHAKDCYISNSSNVFFVQNYFNCLLTKYLTEGGDELYSEINLLIKYLPFSENKIDNSIISCIKSRYFLYLENNIEESLSILKKHIDDFGEDVFILYNMINFYEKIDDLDNMKTTLNKINEHVKDAEPHIGLITECRLKIIVKESGISSVISEIKQLPSAHFSDEYKEKLIERFSREISHPILF